MFSRGAVCFSQSPFLCFHGGQFVFHGVQFVFSRGRVCFSRSPVCVFTGCSFGVHSGKSFCFHGGQFFVFTAASLCFRLLKPTGPIRHLPCACLGAKCDNTLHECISDEFHAFVGVVWARARGFLSFGRCLCVCVPGLCVASRKSILLYPGVENG